MKALCRIVELGPIARGAQQARHRLSPRLVVVDHVDDRRIGIHAGCAGASGRVKEMIAPPPGAFSACILPPWVSTIVREMASPSPIPVALEVTKASNTRGSSSGGMPGPESLTETSASLPLAKRVPISQPPLPLGPDGHGLHGVERQVDDDLLHLDRIRADRRKPRVQLGLERDALHRRILGQQAHRLVEGGVQVDRANLHVRLDQHLADAGDDVAGALVVPLDVRQDLSHDPGVGEDRP